MAIKIILTIMPTSMAIIYRFIEPFLIRVNGIKLMMARNVVITKPITIAVNASDPE